MKRYYLKIEKESIKYLPRLFDKFQGRKLILSLIQENRQLEYVYDIAEYIIYDNSDVLSGIIDLEDAIIDIDDDIDLLPSSYKSKVLDIDLESFVDGISNDYDYILIVLDDNLNYEKPNELIYVTNSPKNGENNIICSKTNIKLIKDNNIYGFLNDNEDDINNLYSNLESDKFMNYNDFSFFERLKGHF